MIREALHIMLTLLELAGCIFIAMALYALVMWHDE